MQIYNYDPQTGQYISTSQADSDPLQPNNWLIPAHATTVAPLPTKDGCTVNFNNGAWAYVEIPAPEPVPEPWKQPAEVTRRAMYQNEADPLFFMWQRGEGTEQAWLDKVAEIKAREIA